MSNRKTIIDNIVNDIKSKVTLVNGYDTEPVQVLDTLVDPAKINQYPSVAVGMYEDVLVEEGNLFQDRRASIWIYGYVNNVDQLFDFSEDLDYFFYNQNSDFVYKDQILPIVGQGVNFRYSGISRSAGVFTFDFMFEIRYTINLNV